MDKTAIAILSAGIFLMAWPAYAYIDPGTGGMLVQLVTGGVAGLIVLAKLYWHRIRAAFGMPASKTHPVLPPSAPPQRADERE
jgi:hypothetical protein